MGLGVVVVVMGGALERMEWEGGAPGDLIHIHFDLDLAALPHICVK